VRSPLIYAADASSMDANLHPAQPLLCCAERDLMLQPRRRTASACAQAATCAMRCVPCDALPLGDWPGGH